MIGSTLGKYQLLEKIGSGGMGEVYKARDLRLNRVVAIKVLPPDKVASPDRKRRFIQEAQAASALQHPNIITVFDIDEENGVNYIVMEYVDGKTVDALIPRNGMRLGEALKTAIPVADGLARAHAAGIVHRDVKPSNIMVASDGRVKILDFGLAKLTERSESSEGDATRPALPRTQDGAILGTISYMSPEQAEAKTLDGRSDIFSFGALLYEMLTGRRAFQADSLASTLSAILKEEPKPIENLPAEVDRILRRCLKKDPARRFQSMADVKVELEEVREESDSGRLLAPVAATQNRNRLLPILIGVLLVTITGIGAWIITRPKTARELRLRQLTADSGLTTMPALSPDGKLVAYASDRAGDGNLDLWVQPLTEGARPIRLTTNPADDSDPSFSPDGGQIVFRSQRGEGGIFVIPSLGGEERLIARGHFPRFSPDGQWIGYSTGQGGLWSSSILMVPSSGGSPKRVGADIPVARFTAWSPDSKYILTLGQNAVGDLASTSLWVVPVGGGSSRRIEISAANRRQITRFDWDGRTILFAEGSTVWGAELSISSTRLENLRRITSGTTNLREPKGTTAGFVFSAGTDADHLWSLPLDLNTGKVTGSMQPLTHGGGSQRQPASSANGKLLAYSQFSAGGAELRIRDTTTQRESVLLTRYARPKLSPDGSRVAFSTQIDVNTEIYIMDSAGGEAKRLLQLEKGGAIYSWTSDGRALIYYRNAPIRFFLFDLVAEKESETISNPKLNIHGVEPSPDLKWVAFHLPDVANKPVKIAPFRDRVIAGESEWITIAQYPGRNNRPWWSPDGNLLYFLSLKDDWPDIWAQRLDPSTKRPVGEAFAVQHFHGIRRTPDNLGSASFGPAIGKDQIIFSLREETGNIWIAEQQP